MWNNVVNGLRYYKSFIINCFVLLVVKWSDLINALNEYICGDMSELELCCYLIVWFIDLILLLIIFIMGTFWILSWVLCNLLGFLILLMLKGICGFSLFLSSFFVDINKLSRKLLRRRYDINKSESDKSVIINVGPCHGQDQRDLAPFMRGYVLRVEDSLGRIIYWK
jgi:hypothetical protein